jgi:predicted amidohydrolase
MLRKEDKKKAVAKNLAHIADCIDNFAGCIAAMEYPVKLVALPEQALQGFGDSDGGVDYPHTKCAREIYNTTVPGPETEQLGAKAKEYNLYILGTIRAVEPEFPDRYFGINFLINPSGKVTAKFHKLQVFPLEASCVPQDVYDAWVEIRGNTLDAFFPVADTQIGKIGAIMCEDGSFPETARGFAMNGAEILFRPTYGQPLTGRGHFELQNRARAMDNCCYVIAPCSGPYYLSPDSTIPTNSVCGDSMVVDYQGNILNIYKAGVGVSHVSTVFDIKALRDYRSKALWPNHLKSLRTEPYRLIYEQPIHPKNLRLDPEKQPMLREHRYRILRDNVRRLTERGTYTPEDYEPPEEIPIEKPGVSNMPKNKEVSSTPSEPALG